MMKSFDAFFGRLSFPENLCARNPSLNCMSFGLRAGQTFQRFRSERRRRDTAQACLSAARTHGNDETFAGFTAVGRCGKADQVPTGGEIADTETLDERMPALVGQSSKGNQVEHSIRHDSQASNIFPLVQFRQEGTQVLRKRSKRIIRGVLGYLLIASFM